MSQLLQQQQQRSQRRECGGDLFHRYTLAAKHHTPIVLPPSHLSKNLATVCIILINVSQWTLRAEAVGSAVSCEITSRSICKQLRYSYLFVIYLYVITFIFKIYTTDNEGLMGQKQTKVNHSLVEWR